MQHLVQVPTRCPTVLPLVPVVRAVVTSWAGDVHSIKIAVILSKSMQIKLHEWCQLTPICCFVVSWVWTRLGLVCLAPCRTSPPGTGSRWHNWKTVGIHLRYQMRWGRSRSPLKAVLSWLLVVYAFLNYSQYMLYGCIYIWPVCSILEVRPFYS